MNSALIGSLVEKVLLLHYGRRRLLLLYKKLERDPRNTHLMREILVECLFIVYEVFTRTVHHPNFLAIKLSIRDCPDHILRPMEEALAYIKEDLSLLTNTDRVDEVLYSAILDSYRVLSFIFGIYKERFFGNRRASSLPKNLPTVEIRVLSIPRYWEKRMMISEYNRDSFYNFFNGTVLPIKVKIGNPGGWGAPKGLREIRGVKVERVGNPHWDEVVVSDNFPGFFFDSRWHTIEFSPYHISLGLPMFFRSEEWVKFIRSVLWTAARRCYGA